MSYSQRIALRIWESDGITQQSKEMYCSWQRHSTDSNYMEEYDDDLNPNIKIVEYLKKKPHPIPEWEEHDKKVI